MLLACNFEGCVHSLCIGWEWLWGASGLTAWLAFLCGRFNEGLEYIKGLPRREAAAALQKYGKVRSQSMLWNQL